MSAFIQENFSERHKRKIINIGAGGKVKDLLKEQNLDFIEVDIDEKRKPDIVADIEDLSVFKNSSVSSVFCMEVLEHVKNPHVAVNELYRILEPGGFIVGSTPFLLPIHDIPHDYYRYTKYGLEHLFRHFHKKICIPRNSYTLSSYVILLRIINVGTDSQISKAKLIFPLLIILAPIFYFINRFVENDYGTTGYFFAFQKPNL